MDVRNTQRSFTARVKFVLKCQNQRNGRCALAEEITMGLQANFQREQSFPPYLAMIVSPDAISLRYCFSQKSPALLSAAALLQARSTPETLQLPPRPAASLPRYGGLLLWPTLAPKMCCAAQQTSEYPLSCSFPRGRSYLSVTSLSGSLTIFSLSFLL